MPLVAAGACAIHGQFGQCLAYQFADGLCLVGRRNMSVLGLVVEWASRVVVQVHDGPVELVGAQRGGPTGGLAVPGARNPT